MHLGRSRRGPFQLEEGVHFSRRGDISKRGLVQLYIGGCASGWSRRGSILAGGGDAFE